VIVTEPLTERSATLDWKIQGRQEGGWGQSPRNQEDQESEMREHLFIVASICNWRKLWKTIMSITMVLAMSMTDVSHTVGAENRPEEKKLYIYSFRELSSFFKYIGYQDLWYNDIRISKNSDGTAVPGGLRQTATICSSFDALW
jgi:hypothetical protein